MEIVDKLNNKRQYLNKTAERRENTLGEYRQSAHTWIINSEGKFLMQKRSPNKRTFPNMWSITGGANDDTKIKRKYDFVDIWLVKLDIALNDLVLQTEEVAAAKWCTIDEIRDMQKNGELAPSIDIYLDMFINLLNYEF